MKVAVITAAKKPIVFEERADSGARTGADTHQRGRLGRLS